MHLAEKPKETREKLKTQEQQQRFVDGRKDRQANAPRALSSLEEETADGPGKRIDLLKLYGLDGSRKPPPGISKDPKLAPAPTNTRYQLPPGKLRACLNKVRIGTCDVLECPFSHDEDVCGAYAKKQLREMFHSPYNKDANIEQLRKSERGSHMLPTRATHLGHGCAWEDSRDVTDEDIKKLTAMSQQFQDGDWQE